MTKQITIGIMTLCLTATVAVAQTGEQPSEKEVAVAAMTMTRAQIQAERQSIVAVNLPLTEQQAQAFWPLYREYRNALATSGDRKAAVILDYAEHYEAMTDAKAAELLKEWLASEEEGAKTRAEWVPKFSEILPAKLVTRFYQIENKLDTLVMLDLVQGIPLMK